MPDAIVHSVPGPWASRPDFVAAIARATAAEKPVLAAGSFMHEVGSKTHSECSWSPRDAALSDRFAATLGRFPDVAETFEQLEGHVSVVYVIQAVPGAEQARTAWGHATACVQAGGHGVFAEVSGLAHTPRTWREEIGEAPHILDLHRLSVLHMYSEEEGYRSSGMTQFGLPDTFVESDDFDEAVDTARHFETYQLLEAPELADNHTFSVAPDAPVWAMTRETHPLGDTGDIDRSPGLWRLRRVP